MVKAWAKGLIKTVLGSHKQFYWAAVTRDQEPPRVLLGRFNSGSGYITNPKDR